MRIAAFDIETTGFSSTYNRLVCACFKFSDEDKVRSKSALLSKDEGPLLTWIVKNYDRADVIVTWNGKLFDVYFVNGRLFQTKRPPLDSKKMHRDLLYDARRLRMTSCKMDHVAENMQTDHQKYHVPAREWIKAAEGNVKSHALIRKHCENDVLITEELFERFLPMIPRLTR